MRKKQKALLLTLVIICVAAVFCFGAYQYVKSREHQLFGRIVSHIETDKKVVALTFDDGPTDYTPEILEMLNALDIKCTFFLTGREIEQNMEYAKAISGAGHQIGNHSYSHARMILKSMAFIEDELDRTNELIREAGYEGTIVFRPPYCKKLIFLPLALERRDMVTVTFDIEPDSYADVASSAGSIADYVEEHVQNGSVILLHIMYDGGATARDAVPEIVSRLQDAGYTFVTVNDFIEMN